MDKFKFDAIVIGGGIIGLTSAVNLQSSGKSVLLLEKNKSLFNETSSRNSGVIHAGIYYSKSPNKEFHCLRGKIFFTISVINLMFLIKIVENLYSEKKII